MVAKSSIADKGNLTMRRCLVFCLVTWLFILTETAVPKSIIGAEETCQKLLSDNLNITLRGMTEEELGDFLTHTRVKANLTVDCFGGEPKEYNMYFYFEEGSIYMNTAPYDLILESLCEQPEAKGIVEIKESSPKSRGIIMEGIVAGHRKEAKKMTEKIYNRYVKITNLVEIKIGERPVVFKLIPNKICSWTPVNE
jgi:hypothetical protein